MENFLHFQMHKYCNMTNIIKVFASSCRIHIHPGKFSVITYSDSLNIFLLSFYNKIVNNLKMRKKKYCIRFTGLKCIKNKNKKIRYFIQYNFFIV